MLVWPLPPLSAVISSIETQTRLGCKYSTSLTVAIHQHSHCFCSSILVYGGQSRLGVILTHSWNIFHSIFIHRQFLKPASHSRNLKYISVHWSEYEWYWREPLWRCLRILFVGYVIQLLACNHSILLSNLKIVHKIWTDCTPESRPGSSLEIHIPNSSIGRQPAQRNDNENIISEAAAQFRKKLHHWLVRTSIIVPLCDKNGSREPGVTLSRKLINYGLGYVILWSALKSK